jgi:DNA-binding transcriptional LysR family regulator
LDGAIANIGRSSKRNQQSISLGTTPLVAANILPPAMREFRKQRPDVRIQLFDADLPTLIQMVEAGKLDMSLGIFKAMPDVRREPFFRFSSMVARAAKDDTQPHKCRWEPSSTCSIRRLLWSKHKKGSPSFPHSGCQRAAIERW